MWTIDLAKIYHTDLGTLTPLQLGKLKDSGIKAKMHRFFARNDWEGEIKAVGASASGRVGVLFLYKADTQDKTKLEASPSYVVKLTDAPHRILFAEYVLKNLGKAKIPKSLVVKLDWGQYARNWNQPTGQTTDSSLKLINVLRDQTRRHPRMQPKSGPYETYTNNLTRLDPNRADKPRYLVIMKGFPVAKPLNPFLQQGVSNPFSSTPDPTQTVAFSLTGWEDVAKWCDKQKLDDKFTLGSLPDSQRSKYFNDPDFQELVGGFCINKWILSDAECMRKAGRVLAACAFLRYGDQLQAMQVGRANISNIFFFLKTYKDPVNTGKLNNPVGVIDNDTLASICSLAELPPAYYSGGNPSFTTSKKAYLKFVLEGGLELLGADSKSLYEGGAPGAHLKNLIENFDTVYFKQFFGAFIGTGRADYALCKELYANDGSLWNAPNRYPTFPDDPTKGEWPRVRDNLKKGFAEVLKELSEPKFLDNCLQIYSFLYDKYGFDYNFDWATLRVSHIYLATSAKVIKDKHEVITGFEGNQYPGDPAESVWYKEILGTVYPLDNDIRNVLTFGIDQGLIDKRKRDEIIRFFTYLSQPQQQKFLVGESKIRERIARIQVVRLALVMLCANRIRRRWLSNTQTSYEDAVKGGSDEILTAITRLNNFEVQGYPFYKLDNPKNHENTAKFLAELRMKTNLKMADYFPEAWSEILA